MRGDDGKIYADSDGFTRVHSHRWGRNLYSTRDDALGSARETLKTTRLLRLWRTEDGLFDWTSTEGPPRSPHLLTAVEVTGYEAAP